ncbi:MAG: Hsp20/alpha crystallin family protein [Succinivibrio sp.]|nr:Hsp20/alpha crystallin family protein [Succinivibrio sp.]
MNRLAKYVQDKNNQIRNYAAPTVFDLFSRPLTDFEEFFSPQERAADFKVDLKDCGDHYQLKADMPGVKKEDIKVDFDDGNLIIRAVHHSEKKQKDEQGFLINERSEGVYQRMFHFDDADPQEINAAYANGELDINLKKIKQEAKVTSVTIH